MLCSHIQRNFTAIKYICFKYQNFNIERFLQGAVPAHFGCAIFWWILEELDPWSWRPTSTAHLITQKGQAPAGPPERFGRYIILTRRTPPLFVTQKEARMEDTNFQKRLGFPVFYLAIAPAHQGPKDGTVRLETKEYLSVYGSRVDWTGAGTSQGN